MPYELPNKDELSDAYKALLATLSNSYHGQNFGKNDSIIASTLMHPIEAIRRGSEGFRGLVNDAAGLPYNVQDESSMYAYGPEQLKSLSAANKLADFAQVGAMPSAPRSSGGTLGMVTLPPTKFSKAHDIAQKNAALPIEQGGLGLPLNNTAMDRAKAMGFDTPAYHGTNADITEFKIPKKQRGNAFDRDSNLGIFLGDSDTANYFAHIKGMESKSRKAFQDPSGMTVFPVLTKSENVYKKDFSESPTFKSPDKTIIAAKETKKSGGIGVDFKNIYDAPIGKHGNTYLRFNPSDIRSRFAAFDPMKKDSANILATTLMGMLLGSQYNGNQNAD